MNTGAQLACASLAGYGAAQALPGPLFSFAAYLSAEVCPTPSALLYGVLGLLGLFAPGLLAMTAVLPFWGVLRENGSIKAALRGIKTLQCCLLHELIHLFVYIRGRPVDGSVKFVDRRGGHLNQTPRKRHNGRASYR